MNTSQVTKCVVCTALLPLAVFAPRNRHPRTAAALVLLLLQLCDFGPRCLPTAQRPYGWHFGGARLPCTRLWFGCLRRSVLGSAHPPLLCCGTCWCRLPTSLATTTIRASRRPRSRPAVGLCSPSASPPSRLTPPSPQTPPRWPVRPASTDPAMRSGRIKKIWWGTGGPAPYSVMLAPGWHPLLRCSPAPPALTRAPFQISELWSWHANHWHWHLWTLRGHHMCARGSRRRGCGRS